MSSLSPRVGVVIRTKDRPLFVTRALRSVFGQAYRGWRVMLVNDGGDPAILEAAIEVDGLAAIPGAEALTTLHLPESIGRSLAFNRGAEALDTDFVCCLDDDDSWHPEFLEALLDLHDRTAALVPDLGGVAALVTAIREDLVDDGDGPHLVTLGEDDLPHAFKRTDFFLDPVAYATYRHDLYPVQWLLRREAVLAAGGFPGAFSVMEDRAFLTRFLQTWRLAILDRKLAFHHRRARRQGDTTQSVAFNTLDNPSYDWRLFSDLAKLPLNSPPAGAGSPPADAELVRATAATVIKELNDETSALWHKVNGEAAAVKARIDALDARIGGVAAREAISAPETAQAWTLWGAVGSADAAFPLGVGTPFLERLELSMAEARPGLLMHASSEQHRMVVQIPRTDDWAALQVSLAGLARRGEALRCEIILGHPQGYLFETALSLWQRDRLGRREHRFEATHVHSCPPGGSVKVTRDFPADWLARTDAPKLSIALPRQALDFRFICHDLVVSRI